MQTNGALESLNVDKQLPTKAEAKDLPNSKISSVYVKANAENDRVFQNVIYLVQNKNFRRHCSLTPSMEGKIQVFFRRFKRFVKYGPQARYP